MPRKVKLVLSPVSVLGYGFMIVFYYIWPDFGEDVAFLGGGKLKTFSGLVWFG